MQQEGRVAIVTGAGSGLGRAIALGLASEGTAVLGLDREAGGLEETAAAGRGLAAQIESYVIDLTDSAALDRLFSSRLGEAARVDILVNNAGIGQQTPFLAMSRQEWDRILTVNLSAVFELTQRTARLMLAAIDAGRQSGGRIVNIASIAGLRGLAGRVAYGTSKGGLISFTETLAVELGPRGITVNAVAPGPVDTPLTRAVHTAATRQAYHQAIPLARYGTPEEIAAAVAFLCSETAGYVNGHTLAVDGGFTSAGLVFELDEKP
jgi:NAD(P)-dependent dehydrogenase (short-subunit alcohol dehydrogenase family)